MSDILITPNRGSSNAPTIQFSGSANASASIRLEVLPEGQVAFLGKSGSLFSISDNMVGSLMAVSDISGLPILEVFSDDRIVMGKYNKNTLYVSGTNVGVGKVPLNAVLDVSGSVAISGSATFAGAVTVPSLTSPASTNLTLGTGTYGTALTVASATGAATFAGAGTFRGNVGIVGPAKATFLIDSVDAATNGSAVAFASDGSYKWIVKAASFTDGSLFTIGTSTGVFTSTPVLSLNYGSAAATFAGAVAIGNTTAVSAAAPSTHKVSILIGGVQYYLLASNV